MSQFLCKNNNNLNIQKIAGRSCENWLHWRIDLNYYRVEIKVANLQPSHFFVIKKNDDLNVTYALAYIGCGGIIYESRSPLLERTHKTNASQSGGQVNLSPLASRICRPGSGRDRANESIDPAAEPKNVLTQKDFLWNLREKMRARVPLKRSYKIEYTHASSRDMLSYKIARQIYFWHNGAASETHDVIDVIGDGWQPRRFCRAIGRFMAACQFFPIRK